MHARPSSPSEGTCLTAGAVGPRFEISVGDAIGVIRQHFLVHGETRTPELRSLLGVLPDVRDGDAERWLAERLLQRSRVNSRLSGV